MVAGAYQHYVIPIGQYFTGSFSHLVFNAENDVNPFFANSYFQNIIIHEGDCDLKNYQTITFPAIADQDTSTNSITLNATSSAGLPISYTVISGPASVVGNVLSFTGVAGYVIVEADQPGDGQYEAAPTRRQKFFVRPNQKAAGDGLRATFYNQSNLTDSATSRVDPEVDFYWSNQRPAPQVDHSSFSAKWEGWVEPPFNGDYTFEIIADDGVRVWINNVLVIDQWQDQASSTYSSIVNLTAWDMVPIRVEYYQNKVFARAELRWTHANFSKEIIPQRFLYTTIPNPLPASSLELSARLVDNHIDLFWETTEEKNVDRFVLERSINGSSFLPLATQASKGDSKYAIYRAEDPYPLPGEYYYRVKMIDIDGTESLPNIASVFVENSFSKLSLKILPNPSSPNQDRKLEIESTEGQDVEVQIWNMEGKLITKYTQVVNQGINVYPLKFEKFTPGMYMIELTGKQSSHRVFEKILIH